MPPASRPTSVSIAPTPPSARECSSLRVALPLPLLRRLLSTHVHSRAASSTPRSPLASTIHLSIHRSIYTVSGRTPPGSTLSPLSLASRLSTQAGVLSDENASSTTATNIQAEASTNPDTGQQTCRAEPDSGLRHGQNRTTKKKRQDEGKARGWTPSGTTQNPSLAINFRSPTTTNPLCFQYRQNSRH